MTVRDNQGTVSPHQQVQPFDEKAALAELERLRESIQAARQARQRSSDEFDAFVKSFRTPASRPTPERPIATSPEPEPQAALESINPSPPSSDPLPSTVATPSTTDPIDERITLPASQAPRRFRFSTRSLGLLVVVAVIAVGLVSTRWRRAAPPPTTVNAVSNHAAPPRNAVASPPANNSDRAISAPATSHATPASPVAQSVTIELRVIRPVWMRVVVDGRKDVEGTVQAGQPLQFTGDSIVVRVGNGGDVFVKTGTREESFGETGQPRTRTFGLRDKS